MGPHLASGPGREPREAATFPGRNMMGASIPELRSDDGRGKGRRGLLTRSSRPSWPLSRRQENTTPADRRWVFGRVCERGGCRPMCRGSRIAGLCPPALSKLWVTGGPQLHLTGGDAPAENAPNTPAPTAAPGRCTFAQGRISGRAGGNVAGSQALDIRFFARSVRAESR